jgi:1-acyl-sn-glycerol-3-phosphate acyltransferase
VRFLFSIRIEFDEGSARLSEGPYVVMMRHASMVDTLLPAALIAGPHRMHLRYVLKAELLADPCLDVAGNRLPNVFVRRGRRGADIPAVAALADDLGREDAILIYPEGTRFTPDKLTRLQASANQRLAKVAGRLSHTLPPRPGGAAALAQAGHDVVFLVHRGLEGLAGVRDILGGALIGARVKAEAWRVVAVDVDLEFVDEWLVDQWQRVDQWVAAEAAAEA